MRKVVASLQRPDFLLTRVEGTHLRWCVVVCQDGCRWEECCFWAANPL